MEDMKIKKQSVKKHFNRLYNGKQEIADKAKVSKSTLNRCLNDEDSSVSIQTLEYIIKNLEKL